MTVNSVPPYHPTAIPPEGRLLAVDWGDKRIGLAVSDELGMLAAAANVPYKVGRESRDEHGDDRDRGDRDPGRQGLRKALASAA